MILNSILRIRRRLEKPKKLTHLTCSRSQWRGWPPRGRIQQGTSCASSKFSSYYPKKSHASFNEWRLHLSMRSCKHKQKVKHRMYLPVCCNTGRLLCVRMRYRRIQSCVLNLHAVPKYIVSDASFAKCIKNFDSTIIYNYYFNAKKNQIFVF